MLKWSPVPPLIGHHQPAMCFKAMLFKVLQEKGVHLECWDWVVNAQLPASELPSRVWDALSSSTPSSRYLLPHRLWMTLRATSSKLRWQVRGVSGHVGWSEGLEKMLLESQRQQENLKTLMVHFICQLDWATGYSDIWSNMTPGVFTKMFLEEVNI